MNILVTGGSGFIGTSLVAELLKEGHRVSIYDKKQSETYPDLCVVGDVRDRQKLANAMAMGGVNAVYHLAAEHHDDVQPPSLYYEVNVGGAENIVYALEKNRVHRLIFTSSVAVYGLDAGKATEESPLQPFNDYSRSKCQSEIVFDNWSGSNHTKCLVTVRPAVIFGEKNRGNVYNLLSHIASRRFVMIGDGKNRKSMGYVQNISKFLSSLSRASSGRQVYNYADKPDLSVEELVRIAMAALGKEYKTLVRIPCAIGLLAGYAFDLGSRITGKAFPVSSVRLRKFCSNTQVSAERLRKTGFTAPYSLKEGLNRMIAAEFLRESENI
jgi:nucleoside-diphosphate-sugar epimerase